MHAEILVNAKLFNSVSSALSVSLIRCVTDLFNATCDN